MRRILKVDLLRPVQRLRFMGSCLVPCPRVAPPRLVRNKYNDTPTFRKTSIPVAPTRRLNDGIQWRKRTVDDIEVKIHTSFNALRRNDPAVCATQKAILDHCDPPQAVCRAKIRRQEKHFFRRARCSQQPVELSGMTAHIQNGTHAGLCRQLVCNLFQRQRLPFPHAPFYSRSLQRAVKLRVIRQNFLRRPVDPRQCGIIGLRRS